MTFMPIKKRTELSPVLSLFDDFLNNAFNWDEDSNNKMMSLDVFENDSEYIVKADMPGVKKGNVKISIHDNDLVIEGVQEAEKKEKNETIYRYERFKGNYRRVLSLPETADYEKAKATLEDGVLTLNIPKKAPAPAKQITIN